MLYYKRFYYQRGVRRVEQIKTPPINDVSEIELPVDLIYHYLSENAAVKGMPADHWLVRQSPRLVMVDHVDKLTDGEKQGSPRPTAARIETEIRNYHSRNRRLKRVRNIERDARDQRTPLVINYAMLGDLYRYTQSRYSRYYEQSNVVATLFDRLNQYESMNRHQFIPINLPSPLPSLSDFRIADEKMTQELIGEFNSFELLIILDIWRWLGSNRDNSHLKDVTTKAISQTNLIFHYYGKWIVISLGKLDQWRQGIDQDGDGDVAPDALQKRFLRMLLSLINTATPEGGEDAEDDNTSNKNGKTQAAKKPLEDRENTAEEVRQTLANVEDDEEIEKDLEAIKHARKVDASVNTNDPFLTDSIGAPENGVINRAAKLASDGLLTPAEYRRYEKLGSAYKSIRDPYTGKGSIEEASVVTDEDVEIGEPTKLADNSAITDKAMLETTLPNFDQRYVNNVLPKDIMGGVLNFTRSGVAITDYEVEKKEDVANAYEIHTVRMTPVNGKSSTVRFKVPTINERGEWVANGVSYRMRKQRADMPIRKVSPVRVALTSYYGKVFVDRSTKVVHDYGKWLVKSIRNAGLDSDDDRVTNLQSAKTIDQEDQVPRLYSILGNHFIRFTAGGIDFDLNHDGLSTNFSDLQRERAERARMTLIGKEGGKAVMVDENNTLYRLNERNEKNHDNWVEVIGDIEDVVGLDREKAPVDVAELKVFGKSIPLGIALCYYIGLEQLVNSLDGNFRWIETGRRKDLGPSEYFIRFNDLTLIVNREDRLASLILGSLNNYKDLIKRYEVNDMNNPDVFFNLLENNGMSQRHLNELDLMQDLFIDPITKEILEGMEEPTVWLGLLRRSAELLLTDYSPSETDLSQMRIRGYERIAGAVYGELVQSMRVFTSRQSNPNAAIELKPFAVWQAIQSDPSKVAVEESNPIKNINEHEAVTFTGAGGRNKVGMVGRTRVYGREDMGTISEATVDSGDVAINTYTTANPKFKSLRGMTNRWNGDQTETSSLLSTSALLSPGATNDDPKRVNFITIQHGQGISAKGYSAMPLRTGYERVIPQRTSDLFAATAKQGGSVKKVNKNAITVEYEDGSQQSVELGRRFGTAAGNTYPHSVVSKLSVGDTFEAGDAIAYNENFFEPDPFDETKVLWKAGVLCKTALMESTDTYEDSSAISERMAEKLGTGITKTRHLFLEFDDSIRGLVKPGDELSPESILCTIEDAVSADNDLFSDETLDTLKLLANNTPRSKYTGVVEKVEVLYYGDKEDMSDTLRALADGYDKELAKKRKALGQKVVTGSVDDNIRIGDTTLELDTLVIKIYITENLSMGQGDKAVFGHQLKTVSARVMHGRNETESGEPIDGIFGYSSVNNRIVLSPEIMGTTNTLLKVLSKRAARIYFGDDN